MSDSNENVTNVVDHVTGMAEKYGFTPDAETAPTAVDESAAMLGIDLSASERERAIDSLT